MPNITFRTILVIGNDHQSIVKKYSADTKVKPYVKMNIKDAEKERKSHVAFLKKLLTDKRIKLSYDQYDEYKVDYLLYNSIDDFEYFKTMTSGCEYNEYNGDALTTDNPEAHYRYERCQQHRLLATGEEGDFSNPFPLLDGTKSYSAHVNDIDWALIHKNQTSIELNGRVWDLVVCDSEPQNERERELKRQMGERVAYFLNNFRNKEEYLNHSTSLWYWGVATDEKYVEVDYTISDMDWILTFYDRFIAPLKASNPLLTIYEVKSLD